VLILGLYVYPRNERTARTAVERAGFADPPHADLWTAAWARDRSASQQTSEEELRVEHGALYPALQRLEARLEQCKVGNLVKQPQSPILFAEIIRCGFTADISFLRLFPSIRSRQSPGG
jgi:predicted secreted hydrolase